MQIYTIYCQINDEVTNNSLELLLSAGWWLVAGDDFL
jgi:hypothetical protein